jgi:trans-aconitate methyltransferase
MDKWDPADYYKHSYPQYAFALGLVERLRLVGSERILDIGCGDGKVTAELAARVPHGSVLGTDNSAEMILFAQNMFPRSVYPNLSFRYEDAVNLTFNQEFDVIVAFASLHWTADRAKVLQGIRSSLAPAGRFAAQLMAKRLTTKERSGSPLREEKSWLVLLGERIFGASRSKERFIVPMSTKGCCAMQVLPHTASSSLRKM